MVIQSEVYIRCNFNREEQMVETTLWKRLRSLEIETGGCRVCEDERETVHYLFGGSTLLIGMQCFRIHMNVYINMMV